MTTILCDAIPFCYGPAAALLALGQALAQRGFVLRAVAGGTTAQLLEGEDTFDVVRCDASAASRAMAIRRLLPEVDLYLNVMDPETYREVADAPVPKVYVDFLFWMFSPRFAGAEVGADLYLIEGYPGSRGNLERYGHLLKAPLLIPPLVLLPVPRIESGPRRLLVCFGGLESPLTRVGVNTSYPDLMAEAVLDAVSREPFFEEVIITGERRTMERLATKLGRRGVSFVHLPHRQFLEELSRASVLLTHPGLYAPFEGFSQSIPTLFLPSSNYTQILQLRFYREAGVAPWSCDWEDLGITPPSGPIPEGLPEQEGVSQVLNCIRIFEASRLARRALHDALFQALANSVVSGSKLVAAQRQFFGSISWGSGPDIAAEAIGQLAAGAQPMEAC
jgi:hypothetical protein